MVVQHIVHQPLRKLQFTIVSSNLFSKLICSAWRFRRLRRRRNYAELRTQAKPQQYPRFQTRHHHQLRVEVAFFFCDEEHPRPAPPLQAPSCSSRQAFRGGGLLRVVPAKRADCFPMWSSDNGHSTATQPPLNSHSTATQ